MTNMLSIWNASTMSMHKLTEMDNGKRPDHISLFLQKFSFRTPDLSQTECAVV
jgi:hypothetical protein